MRMLAVAVLFAFAAPPLAAADNDKDEDKAKEAALALLKAVKAKDLDALMKLTTAPFVYRDGDKPMLHKEAADVKAWFKEKLDGLKNTDKVPTEIDRVVPLSELRDKIKDEDDRKLIEEAVGKDGFAAFLTTADDKKVVILIRIKDGKAKVAGLGQH